MVAVRKCGSLKDTVTSCVEITPPAGSDARVEGAGRLHTLDHGGEYLLPARCQVARRKEPCVSALWKRCVAPKQTGHTKAP
ncbi:hypothetical protein AAFF_G00099590 [Aldrovandia affinis]|uniref:Uncharacterized protein n=1 Tax=Aldrovandia affinis TaxID=143900 RepID=A0AAD7RUZ7_9TELE|nr:hypothetical protein AAFF_G00099590 [Aldrovandia affinis]